MEPSHSVESQYYRLARNIVPVHYSLEFALQETYKFTGVAKIDFTLEIPFETPTSSIILHSRYLDISPSSTSLVILKDQEEEEEETTLSCTAIREFEASETNEFVFSSSLPNTVGRRFRLHISYSGCIQDYHEPYGIYHSSSTDPTRISTHFEPTQARYAYPCYDEPCFISTFQLTLVVPSDVMTISNTPIEEEEPLEEGKRVTFERTAKIHTCVVGFNLGTFTIIENYNKKGNVLCRVAFDVQETGSEGWFALDLLTKAVDFFEDFFQYELPLKKLDLVSLEEFDSLGMENWGMINLKQGFMLVSESTPLERRQRITRLIGHEVCHMWFGDLVAIDWWDGLWLKEGMCRYLEFFFADWLVPSWGIWSFYYLSIFDLMLREDADSTKTHPVECCNGAPREIEGSFDQISYAKGSAVLRLLFSLTGIETLKKSTNLLMQRQAGATMRLADFQQCLEDVIRTEEGAATREEKLQQVRVVLDLVKTSSHPYFLIQGSPNGFSMKQFAPPGPHGVLIHYLQERQQAGERYIDLLSAPLGEEHTWDPNTRLSAPAVTYVTPMTVLEIKPCQPVSPLRVFHVDTREMEYKALVEEDVGAAENPGTIPEHPHYMCYFNFGATAICRCDYDIGTWKRIFEIAPYLRDDDRLCISTTLVSHRNTNIGHFPGEKGERCTLFLEWVMNVTQSPNTMNNYLWEFLTLNLEKLVYMTQNYYCRSVMMEFVSSLYAPLVQRCLLSFFAQEKTINFNAQVHLSRQVVLNILNVLALCGSKAIAEEVEEVYRWALGDMFAHSPHAASATTEPTPSTSLISPLNSTRDVSRARMFRSSRMVFTHNSILSAIISLEYKVESGDVECWCQLASIIGHILDLPLSDYEQEIGVRFPTPDFGDRSRTEIEAMLNTVVPAFASYENEKAFRLMGTVVSGFPSLTTSVVKALCRNSRFFAYLLENCEIHPQALNFILVVSAPFCSNGHIIALLKARLANDSTQVDIDKFKHITFASEYVATMEPATKNNYSANTVKKSPSYMEEKLPRALEEMEANCIWMDYCCMHFDAFLLETQKKKFWFPRTASSVCLSASGVLENPSESASAAGVSI